MDEMMSKKKPTDYAARAASKIRDKSTWFVVVDENGVVMATIPKGAGLTKKKVLEIARGAILPEWRIVEA